MAEREPKLENTEIVRKDDGPNPPNPLSSLFSNVLQLFNFPPSKRDTAKPGTTVSVTKETRTVVDDAKDETKPVVVTFPDTRPAVPPLKLEAEDSEQNTNPVFLWQVYAIGGFFILRWAWARWNERRAKKKSSNDDPPPADD